jgi:hypothetical protein
MARLRKVAIAVADAGGVLGERHVSDVLQGLGLSASSHEYGELVGAGLFGSGVEGGAVCGLCHGPAHGLFTGLQLEVQ